MCAPASDPRRLSLAFSSTSVKRLTAKKAGGGDPGAGPLAGLVAAQSCPPVGSVLALNSASDPGSVDTVTLDAVRADRIVCTRPHVRGPGAACTSNGVWKGVVRGGGGGGGSGGSWVGVC